MRTTSWLIGLLLLAVLSVGGNQCRAAEATIFVSAIVTDESEILSAREIAAITNQYVGKEVTVAQLHEVVAKINQLYEQKGFLTAKAILPAQTVKQGVVRIRLVEGRVGRVEVTGNTTALASFYTQRIRITPGELVRLDRVAEEVGYFNHLHSDQVRVQVQPGQEFGTTDFLLVVDPAPDQRIVYIDNGGRADTGLYRFGANYVRQHLLRRGDPLTVSAVGAEGMLAGSIRYQIPIGTRGAWLSAGYDASKIRVMTPAFRDLDITGNSSAAHLEFNYPLSATSSLVVSSPLQFRHKYSSSTYSGASLPGTIVRAAAIGLNLQWQVSTTAGVSQCSYQVGDSRLASENPKDAAALHRVYCSFAGQTALAGNLALKWRGALQSSEDPLPTTEKLSIGGVESVRGYSEGVLSGDLGYCVGLELVAPISPRASMSMFIDHGGAFPARGAAQAAGGSGSTNWLTGYGASFTMQVLSEMNWKMAFSLSKENKPTLYTSLQLAF
jgi:hemolysin activation/secretion protein